MEIMTKEKRNLETLSDDGAGEILLSIAELGQRVRSMTEIVRDMNYKTERFIRDFYAQGNSRGHSPVYSSGH